MTSGRPAFQQHAKRAEGSDTTPTSHTHVWHTSHNFDRSEKRSRSPAGPRRLETATRISASLSRRLSAFFGSTPGQDPKAAKYTFLIPGPGMFVNVRNVPRVVIAPNPKRPLFRRVCRCVRFFEQSRVCTRRSPLKRTLRRLWEKLKDAMKSGLKQRCDGNFRTIFAGTILSEKPNFLSRIFGR